MEGLLKGKESLTPEDVFAACKCANEMTKLLRLKLEIEKWQK